jgi:hypothetical protein
MIIKKQLNIDNCVDRVILKYKFPEIQDCHLYNTIVSRTLNTDSQDALESEGTSHFLDSLGKESGAILVRRYTTPITVQK